MLTRTATRRGYTLAELLVAVVLLGVVAVTVSTVAARQQRLFRGSLLVLDSRGQLRQGAAVIEGLLRGISPAAGDLIAVSDSALEVVATIGGSVVCASPGAATLDLPAPDSGTGPGLTAWLASPQPGDTLFVYDERGPAPGAPDSVRGYRVSDAAPLRDACAGGPLAAAAPPGSPGLRLTVQPAPPRPVGPGAVVRLGRRMRLALYRSPTDGLFYLGLREWAEGVPQPVQPVSGPYRGRSRGAGVGAHPGVAFRYADSLGAAIEDQARASDVARIDVVLRPPDDEDAAAATLAGSRALDSLLVRVALRNRRRGGGF